MRIDLYTNPKNAYMEYAKTTETAAAKSAEETAAAQKEAAVQVEELEKEAAEKRDQVMISTQKEEKNPYADFYATKESKFKISTSKPSDSSSALTRRLVNAQNDFEVRMVMSSASSSMIGLRIIASVGEAADKQKAKAILAKLEKLMSRAMVKLKDLDDEAALQQQKVKHAQKKQTRRAEEIKEELRSRQRQRMNKETRYLLEQSFQAISGNSGENTVGMKNTNDRMDPATEAEIAMLAEAMAAAEAASGSVGGGGADIAAGGGEGVAVSGEAAAGGGGEVAVEGGGVDLSV